jgi:phospholipid/cholesterol/gamma-HCH transport system substrate-binding protein
MRKIDLELSVGIFMLIGVVALAYLSVRLGRLEIIGGGRTYTLYAEFANTGGLKQGASVEIAGVEIGKVRKIKLDNYQALVEFTVTKDVEIQDDAIASVKTKGLIGEKYIGISPGGSDRILKNGGRIRETESAVDIEQLISKYIFGKV